LDFSNNYTENNKPPTKQSKTGDTVLASTATIPEEFKNISKNLFGDESEQLYLTHNYLYGGTEFENKVGLMIYLNDEKKTSSMNF